MDRQVFSQILQQIVALRERKQYGDAFRLAHQVLAEEECSAELLLLYGQLVQLLDKETAAAFPDVTLCTSRPTWPPDRTWVSVPLRAADDLSRERPSWNHVDGSQPLFDQRRPLCDWLGAWPESIGMAALRIQVQFRGNVGVLQRQKIRQRIPDIVDRVVFRLNEKRRWRALRNSDPRVQREIGRVIL